jgi:glycosyltransferase involved in cell wall biosynthesis
MSEQPLVSVLMTSYNREKYITEAIESVLASSYKNFELIICDDQSKDNTVTIAKQYEEKDTRVKVFVNEVNLGDYPNRNKAASYARGKYLKYVDADDYIYPWGLATLVQMMEQFPKAGWGLCSLPQYILMPFPFVLTPKQAYEYNYQGPGLFHKAPLSSIITAEAFNDVMGFDNLRMAGDFDMWHRLAKEFDVVLMPEGIVWYREHGEQEMNNYKDYAHVYEEIKLRHLKDVNCPLDQKVVFQIISAAKKNARRNFISSLVRLRFKEVKSGANRLKLYNEK